MNKLGIPVYKDPHMSLFDSEGKPLLFRLLRDAAPGKPYIVLVHPDRWDAFFMAINQPDVFAHPEVRELLGLQPPGER